MGSVAPPQIDIIDIRRDKTEQELLDVVNKSLKPKDGSPPSLPTLLLYDEQGLKLFEAITHLEEYYLTNAEIEVLLEHASTIAARIPAGTRLIELGSGNLRKVNILLEAFERAEKEVSYVALDLSFSELERTLAEIDPTKYRFVSIQGLHGTYDDGLQWLCDPVNKTKHNCVMTLGSSLGNFSRSDAASFLHGFKEILQPSDFLLVGLDACQDHERVFAAYNDSKDLTQQFYRNGLNHVNQLLGYKLFQHDQWAIEGVYDDADHVHKAFYVALEDVQSEDFSFVRGQKLFFESAYKYAEEQADALWHRAGLVPQMKFANRNDDYHLHLLSPSTIAFSDQPAQYAARPVPNLSDWETLWSAWDTVTKSMVPRDELLNKPIKLRNNLIFYLGHIPAFADIHYVKATGSSPTNPANYMAMFERGIDPDVDNPESCHAHSEIPDTWPPLEEILAYTASVRSRIMSSTKSGKALRDRKLGRGLWLAFEHEAMHLETFLYMLLQSSRVLPPPGMLVPDFRLLAKQARSSRELNQWHTIPSCKLQIGLDDPENDSPPDRYFGWDNERPARMVDVPGFQTQSRSISNGEYAKFLEDTGRVVFPSAWLVSHCADKATSDDDRDLACSNTASVQFLAGKAVRTVFGPVPLLYALDWPVMASYDELEAYATWAEARIPTFEEARSIYAFVEAHQKLELEQMSSRLISAVNGHLCNDGVEETPPHADNLHKTVHGSEVNRPDSGQIFTNLHGCNVGFKAWHPTAITSNGDRLRGQADAGGLWEWTSSPLVRYNEFKAMDLYPGYTADFFDDKHNICLGGSWATIPRIAGRKSFVNWYQRNYPYTWATARLARSTVT